jgi:aspartate/methionine/tyrosine aminotransferase
MSGRPLDQAANMSAQKLSEASPEFLQMALIAAMTEVTQAKKQLEHIEHALDMRYAQRAKALRLAQGKDTGVIHFNDGNVCVTADLPKKVERDQKQLHELILRIASGGDNPAEFIETSYRVSETKYQAWQESLRSQFAPARTVKVGKATYRLALLSE